MRTKIEIILLWNLLIASNMNVNWKMTDFSDDINSSRQTSRMNILFVWFWIYLINKCGTLDYSHEYLRYARKLNANFHTVKINGESQMQNYLPCYGEFPISQNETKKKSTACCFCNFQSSVEIWNDVRNTSNMQTKAKLNNFMFEKQWKHLKSN